MKKYLKGENVNLGADFVLIQPGTFMMGSRLWDQFMMGNRLHADETPHQVTLTKSFYMQITQVTQVQWMKVMRNNPSYFQPGRENCPVENVSWDDIQEFIAKLNQQGNGIYRLPTEAEWEYAARAGTTVMNGSNLDSMGWYRGNAKGITHPVAQKQPNVWGLYDMHGNVWEWCQDWYGEYPSGSVSDPTGVESGSNRVLRGGSWSNDAQYCRPTYRYSDDPSFQYRNNGFRLIHKEVE